MGSRRRPDVEDRRGDPPLRRILEDRARALDHRQRLVDERVRTLVERHRALAERERSMAERERRIGAGAGANGREPAAVWSLPADAVATEIRDLMHSTGDELAVVATGIGVEPEWALGVLTGEITDVDLDHIQRLCEGLHCSPYDLFGTEAGRAIAHAYGPELWPRFIEPLDRRGLSGDGLSPR